MPTLENLLERIEQTYAAQADEILEKARAQAGDMLEKARKQAAESADASEKAAHAQAAVLEKTLNAEAAIHRRDMLLSAKNAFIESVLAKAAERLTQMDAQTFEEFLINTLKRVKPDGDEEIILPAGYENVNLERVNAALSLSLRKHAGARSVESGFALIKADWENSNTIPALMKYYSDGLETLVLRTMEGV